MDYFHDPRWKSQSAWRKAIFDAMARMGLTGLHAMPMHRHWIEIHRRSMPLAGLDESLAGLKIVQISDLHYSPMVWENYLMQFMEWINEMRPDVVVATGDLITGGYRYSGKVAKLLSTLKTSRGVICILGNHDYSIHGRRHPTEGRRRGDHLHKALEDEGIVVLRNESWRIKPLGSGKGLTFVGLDDEWSGRMDAEEAFEEVGAKDAVVCLNHNPANCLELMDYPWEWMLSGHTHGRQLAASKIGKKFVPHLKRKFTHGYYSVEGRHLYVNRGLAYGQREKRWCRPEITVFKTEKG